jgi:tetratricopeptide (TPR) repeat protein
MSSGAQPGRIAASHPRKSSGGLLERYATPSSVSGPQQTPPTPFTLNIHMTVPPSSYAPFIMQRADEINTMERMLTDTQISTLMVVGASGSGKSTLAGLLFQRLQLARQSGLPAPRHLIWLGIEPYTSITNIISAIMDRIGTPQPGLMMWKPDQQLSALLYALRNCEGGALIVLDQFEMLLYPEMPPCTTNQAMLPLFLEFLQMDLGSSRFLLTSYEAPDESQLMPDAHIRSYLVSRISLPEGITLLQQWGVNGSPEDLSLVWQRCGGHTFALVLFGALVNISGISLSYLLNSPDYQPMWTGEVVLHFITAIYHFLNPVQYTLMRTLSLFYEPVSFEGIMMTISGDSASSSVDIGLFERELNLLTRLSLVQQVPGSEGVPCYTLHQLLRRYALEYYIESTEQPAGPQGLASGLSNPVPRSAEELQIALATGHTRAANYYRYAIQKHYPPRPYRKGLRDIAPLLAGIRHLCLAGNWQSACNLLFEEELPDYMSRQGAWYTLIDLYTSLLPPAGSLQPRDEGLISSQLGLLYGRLADYPQSQAYFEHALNILRQLGDHAGEVSILLNQGELLREWGERELASQSFAQAAALNQQARDPYLQCAILHNQGLLLQEDHKYEEAARLYAQALTLAQGPRGQRDKGLILTNLGMLLYEQERLQEGLSILLAALKLRQELHDPTVSLLERFLKALEQKVGPDAYAAMYQSALQMQPQVLARFGA